MALYQGYKGPFALSEPQQGVLGAGTRPLALGRPMILNNCNPNKVLHSSLPSTCWAVRQCSDNDVIPALNIQLHLLQQAACHMSGTARQLVTLTANTAGPY